MIDEHPSPHDDAAEELLRRALLDDSTSVAVSLKVDGLPLSEAVTVIFHGRRDLGTLQTYVAPGSLGAGEKVAASALLRVPCDLDLADAEDRGEAERLYLEQACALRDALICADVVLDVWREPLHRLSRSTIAVARSVYRDPAFDPAAAADVLIANAAARGEESRAKEQAHAGV